MNAVVWFWFWIREKCRPVTATKVPVMPAFNKQGQEAEWSWDRKRQREGGTVAVMSTTLTHREYGTP